MLFSIIEFANQVAGVPTFRRFPLRDANPLGGTVKQRWICEPNEAMRAVHAKLIRYLRALPLDWSSSAAGRPGDSPVRNVLRHRHHRYFYLTDIHNAYRSVEGRRLAGVLATVDMTSFALVDGAAKKIYQFLLRYCLAPEGGLAVGLPASPDLFNVYAAHLVDPSLRTLAERYGITYSRYLDDLTFSSDAPIGARKRRAIREEVVRNTGFSISHRKSEVRDIKTGAVFVNGVGITPERWLFLPRHYLRRLNGHLHLASRGAMKPAVIEGMMGVFKSFTRTPAFNRTELKTWKRYKRFRASIGAKR